MKRGEVWCVDFHPSIAGEIEKVRPALIVSNDASNRHLNRLQVIPLTTKVDRIYPSEALVTFRGKKHKAMVDQLTTASKNRFEKRMGRLSDGDVTAVEEVIRIQLGLRE